MVENLPPTIEFVKNLRPRFMKDNQVGGTDMENCSECGQHYPFHTRYCPYCQADIGFPNVRKAMSAEEIGALDERYSLAVTNADERGISKELHAFEKVVAEESNAVICTSFGQVIRWLEPGGLFTSFHNEITIGARIAQDNKFDKARGSVDSLLFPEYSEKIIFAALSLNELGIPYYGDYSVGVKEDAIAKRATVFHENSYKFMESRNVNVASEVPAGYRCSWECRGRLAVAKHWQEIDEGVENKNFNGILLKPAADGEDSDGDFVEVHIYDGLLREAIQSIACNQTEGHEYHILKEKIRNAGRAGIEIKLF